MEDKIGRLDERCDKLTTALQEGYILSIGSISPMGHAWDVSLVPILPDILERKFYFSLAKRKAQKQTIQQIVDERKRISSELPKYDHVKSEVTLNDCLVELVERYVNKETGIVNPGTVFRTKSGCGVPGRLKNGEIGAIGDVISWDGIIGYVKDSKIYLGVNPKKYNPKVPEATGLSSTRGSFNAAFHDLAMKIEAVAGRDMLSRTGRSCS